MKWIELVGSPGVGKSTLIDYRFPADYIKYDNSKPPAEWGTFLKFCNECLNHMKWHSSYRVGKSLINRSIKKMTTVHNKKSDTVYIQTGFVQRALGIYYRLKEHDKEKFTSIYLKSCPISLGVITLYADKDVIKKRNIERNKQNRSFMIDETEKCMNLIKEIIKSRKVPLLELNTEDSIEHNRKKILEFEQGLIK